MCGIFFLLNCNGGNDDNLQGLEQLLVPLITRRGPDACNCHATTITNKYGVTITLTFHGTVLHLRGDLTKQPQVNTHGDVLLWNGEVFGGEVQVSSQENDTQVLFKKLTQRKTDKKEMFESHEKESRKAFIIQTFASILGPWACVYFDAISNTLWFGRDYFGRRSLMQVSRGSSMIVTSVGVKDDEKDFTEIPSKYLYSIDLDDVELSKNILHTVESHELNPHVVTECENLQTIHRCLTAVNDGDKKSGCTKECCECYNQVKYDRDKLGNIQKEYCDANCGKNLSDNVETRVQNICKDGCVCHKGDNVNHQTQTAFGDHSSSVCNNGDNATCGKPVEANTVENENICGLCCKHEFYPEGKLMTLTDIESKFFYVLQESVRRRVQNVPKYCENQSSVGILFSGGIDSVVLAALADRCLPEDDTIDLINVAFQQKPKISQNTKKKYIKPSAMEGLSFDVPDRLTGRSALTELNRKRQWNFIEVDVTVEELQEERNSRISNLVYPLTTVLDDSIGCAIWFAARGKGKLYKMNGNGELQLSETIYQSTVKVVLTGMGADEQLGGYARHRTKFESQGWKGLRSEMEMEIDRISSRNLGRDDRCISDHGREARFPFLDEHVISFLKSLPVCVKCDPRLPRGYGEKILLRDVAAKHLYLSTSSRYPKRAIQFGSRIAKLESGKEKGSEKCERLR